ncbi:WD40 repeat domain-containing protein, partial [Ktedonospora formicarum]|uniref:WD40 repeat domain-containing protein n=1 Tax=Ktedonospora formicarum TaxID=2778364 RepID=UPI001C68738F
MLKRSKNSIRKFYLVCYVLAVSSLSLLLAACGSAEYGNGTANAETSPNSALTTMSPAIKSTSAPGKVLSTYNSSHGVALATSWSPDGKRVASVGFDSTVQVWNATSGKLIWQQSLTGTHSVAWSPDGKYVAVGTMVMGGDAGEGLVYVLSATDGERQFISQKHNHGITGVSWSPDSTRIAYGVENGIVEVLDLKNNGRDNKTYHLDAGDLVGAVAFSPDGNWLAWVVTTPGTPKVTVVDIASGEAKSYQEHTDLINAIAWSPDSTRIASVSNDKTVRVWTVTTDETQQVYTGHSDMVLSVSWSSDGKYMVSGSTDKTAQVFNAATGKKLFTFKKHTGSVFSVSWSPDSKRVVSTGEGGTEYVWQAV